jgi:hypothetical protein
MEAFPLKGKIKKEGGEKTMQKKIKGIEGLTVEVDVKRIVRYYGAVCALIGRSEVLCEQQTSYEGIVMRSEETYQTPIGVVRRLYRASGAGLDRTSVEWELVSSAEQESAQKRFRDASIEMAAAKTALEMLNA